MGAKYDQLDSDNTSQYSSQVKLQLVRALIAKEQYHKAIAIAEKIHSDQEPLTTLFDAARNKLLVIASFGVNECVGAKNYLAKYDNAVSNKFVFDWGRRIPSDVSLDYVDLHAA